MYKVTGKIPYMYKNCPVPGGGYVTGFVFHPNFRNILYARTDIGGMYRFSFESGSWNSLCSRVTAEDTAQTYPLSMALDENDPDTLFFVCGNKKNNYLTLSRDGGRTLENKPLPCPVHGNEVGRSTGERLAYKNGVLWFASQSAGLFTSSDMGEEWESVSVNGEKNLTFIRISPDGSIMLAGTNGEVNSPDGRKRGPTLYFSADSGKSFTPVETPEGCDDESCDYIGFVPQKAAFDGSCLYITFCQSGKIRFGGMGAYSCDTGSVFDGRVYRYIIKNGAVVFDRDITPSDPSVSGEKRRIRGGFCACEVSGGTLYVSTVCREGDDIIYRSRDCGESWSIVLKGLEVGIIDWTVSYMKPEYNGGRSCIHWISDFKVSPFNKDFAVFNTGTGIFFTENLTSETVRFAPLCRGLEETVHLNVYSPTGGDIHVIDIIGDLGGFAFKDPPAECENSFADTEGNRYITCLNADFPDKNPEYVVCTPRGNWTGKTKGGVILSHDQCKSWTRLPSPRGFTEEADNALDAISQPNTDSGWTAVSADSKRIIWTLSCKRVFRSDMTFFTDNEGLSWKRSEFYDINGAFLSIPADIKIFSDRTDENVFYGITEDYRFFASCDKGESFREAELDISIPHGFRIKHEIRAESGGAGRLWIANGIDGLYLLEFDKESFSVRINNLLCGGDYARCIGFGKGKNDIPALFTVGRICGKYGFYRSFDYGETWSRINSDDQCFGDIISVCGDPRIYGRIYIATGTRGLLYGDERR